MTFNRAFKMTFGFSYLKGSRHPIVQLTKLAIVLPIQLFFGCLALALAIALLPFRILGAIFGGSKNKKKK